MRFASRLLPVAAAAALFSVVVALGWITLAAAQSAPEASRPQRVLGNSTTLANHDVWNPGDTANGIRYSFTPRGINAADLDFSAFYISPTHMTDTAASPGIIQSSLGASLTWSPLVTAVQSMSWTHVGYSIGETITDCVQSVSGGVIEFLVDGEPMASNSTANVDWCGKDKIPFDFQEIHAPADGPGDAMTAYVDMVGGESVRILATVGVELDDLPADVILTRMVEFGDRDSRLDFEETFDSFTDTVDLVLDAEARAPIYTFSPTVTRQAHWLGIVMVVQRVNGGQELGRSFFARSVEEHDPVQPITPTVTPDLPNDTPTPPPTSTPVTPTITPTPTDTPTPITPTPPGPPPIACPNIESKVPAAELSSALANPGGINGYGQRCFPSQPASPFNPLRRTLGLQNPNRPYHPIFNPLIFRCGC